MFPSHRNFKIVLLGLSLAHLLGFMIGQITNSLGIRGYLYSDGSPVGADFINLWSSARMVLAGRWGEIYVPDAFMAYQLDFIGSPIGHRVWAYPPTTLLFSWPFGLLGFYPALLAWSVLGLAVLWYGARRFGFDGLEIAIILTSPATVLCVYGGQSGSLFTGLMLIALAAGRVSGGGAGLAASLLTMKPQSGFLLPLLWLFQKRWRAIAVAAVGGLSLALASLMIFGSAAWLDYAGKTLPELSLLEKTGHGLFTLMIPSTFMAVRILTGDGDLAVIIHGIAAVLVGIVLIVRLRAVLDPMRRAAMVLIATVLMTPYMHNYDLALLLCAALLIARRPGNSKFGPLGLNGLVVMAWGLPQLVIGLNAVGLPISPLLILPLLFLA
ncbi:glycosyltransferase family 87 protein [Devosia rhodophyticola]|uniref:Glycosyltransferase family 87 protein n=1 Tax=Devosia rhodophyticola TaxID=3026423 RepID=A0ABY7YTK5_9HYPH|nr:glycosyltransferase family 87 protein [Devosia rhodophyticola]WDR04716.1 glycosyltransferase family 87 protein [Devosia rhodophyticola]